MAKKNVVLYLNQFFAGIGGEDKADVGFGVSEKPIGPGALYAKYLKDYFGDDAELVATIYCGDNYFSKDTEASTAEAIKLIEPYKPDIFFAGPGFAAGRYCESCGAMCKAVKEKFNIPVISAMRDDCKSEYNKIAYIIKTNENSATMRDRVGEMVKLAKYLTDDHSNEYTPLIDMEHLPDPDEYNYFRQDKLCCSFTDKTVAERSVEKLLAKVKGEPFETEVVPERLEIVPCPPAIKDMSKCTICLVSDGGLVPKGNPDRMATRSNLIWNSYDLEALFKDYEVVHAGYFNDHILHDPNRLLPVDVMKDMVKEGELGGIDELTYAMPACTTVSKKCEENGAIIAQDILAKGKADAVILTST